MRGVKVPDVGDKLGLMFCFFINTILASTCEKYSSAVSNRVMIEALSDSLAAKLTPFSQLSSNWAVHYSAMFFIFLVVVVETAGFLCRDQTLVFSNDDIFSYAHFTSNDRGYTYLENTECRQIYFHLFST